MVNKHKQQKKKNFNTYGKSNKEVNALIEKKIKSLQRIRIGGRQKKNFSTSNKCRFVPRKVKVMSPAW